MSAKFKWLEIGNSYDQGSQFFIVPADFDPAMLQFMSEDEISNVVVAQAQSAEWAERITNALNAG